ncbi:MAG: hypothetical protein ACI9OJ_002606, partial [Myxococcota bacterium]
MGQTNLRDQQGDQQDPEVTRMPWTFQSGPFATGTQLTGRLDASKPWM